MNLRRQLIAAYFDFVNNYLTIEKYAEHNGLTVEQATAFVALARQVSESKHPEE